MPEWIVFSGPTLESPGFVRPRGMTFVAPIRRLDLLTHFEAGRRHFVILDGEFSQSLSVSVTEIRQVLEGGAVVCGASSMGALRAVEARPIGMRGHGWVFEQYLSGNISADDEVALLFDPKTRRALTHPLVNLRWCLEQAASAGLLEARERSAIIELGRALAFERRTFAGLRRAAPERLRGALERVERWASEAPARIERKRLDALELLEMLAAGRLPEAGERLEERREPRVEAATVLPRESFLGTARDTRKHPGTHRQRSLSEILPAAELDARRAGMSRLAEVGTLDDCGVYVFNAIRPGADSRDNTVNGGVGLSRESARVAALAETIERAAMCPRRRQVRLATWAELRKERRALHPPELVLNADRSWSEATELAWWPMTELRQGEEVWVPATAVFFPEDRGAVLHEQSSTGLATGASLPEAVLYGLLECVEREAKSFWTWTRRGRQLTADALSASGRELIAHLGRSGIEVHAWHIEAWVELPTLAVVLEDHARCDARFFTGGTACHLDPRAAFEKALLEALYARFAVISGSREDLREQSEPYAARTYEQARREVLACCPTGPSRRLSELPDRSTPSIAGDIAEVLHALGRAGLERVLACDLSSEHATLKTARVVVPGLECCLKKARIGPRLVQWVEAWGPARVAAA